MAAQKAESNLYYRVPEEALNHLKMVRDSLTLLVNCADTTRETIDPQLLASHLHLLVEQMNSALNEAMWNGARL